MARSRWIIVAATAVAITAVPLAASPAAPAGSSYTYQQVTPAAHGGSCAEAAVNSMTAKGELLGTEYCTASGVSRGFLLRHGRTHLFSAPGKHVDTLPAGISPNGKYLVVATEHDYAGRSRSYERVKGKFHQIADPKAGGGGTDAEGINDHREVVGLYYRGQAEKHWAAFVYRHGHYRTFHLHVTGARNVALTDVNDSGQLSGFYQDGRHRFHGFLVRGHKTTVVNAPGAGHGRDLGTVVSAITGNGTYCGSVFQRRGSQRRSQGRAWIHRRGHETAIRVPKSSHGHSTEGSTCNDSGAVAGDYIRIVGSGWERMAYEASRS